MFKSIEISNFGVFPPEGRNVPLGNLTFIVGPNNSGKSTVLSAFAALATSSLHPGLSLPPVKESGVSQVSGILANSFFILGPPTSAFYSEVVSLLKFRSGEEATFTRKNVEPISLQVNGTFDGHDATFRLYLSGYPLFNRYRIVLEASQEARSFLYNALGNTWIFPSNRTFPGPFLQTGITVNNLTFGMNGSNMIQFLLERFTARDEGWSEAEQWLKKSIRT